MININEETIENMLKDSPSERIFVNALSVYKLRKTNIRENGLILLICTFLSVILGINLNVVSLVVNTASIFLNVFLALFGIVFTGYAIFQTLLSDRLIMYLFADTHIDQNSITKSKLQETNESFVRLMMIFIFGIVINIILNILIPVIPQNYCLFDNIYICNTISIILIDYFLYIMGVTIWRMVSFIANIFHLLNAYAVSKLLDAMNDDHEK